MRFIHTADWHVGKTLRGKSRSEDHQLVLKRIVDLTREYEVDAVLICGDLFDAAAPSPEAEKMVFQTLTDLAETGAQILVIAGNHDHPGRLLALNPLFKLANIYAVSQPLRPKNGGVFDFRSRQGEKVSVAMLPFLTQKNIIRADALMSRDPVENIQQYAWRAQRIIESLCHSRSDTSVNLFMGHAMLHGGVLGGGERLAHTIFEYSISASAFPVDLHYVAMGHLHRIQQIPGGCPIWYSGSPLPLDFSETQDVKSINLVEATPGLPALVTNIPLPTGRKLRTLRGTFSQLQTMSDQTGEDLLKIILDEVPAPGLADQVRELFPYAVDVRVENKQTQKLERQSGNWLEKSPQELFTRYLESKNEKNEDLIRLFIQLLEEIDETTQT